MKARLPVNFTTSQKAAYTAEINRQILENDEKFERDRVAVILWTLHTEFGFGEKRLKKFWKSLYVQHQKLREYYQMMPSDDGWLCKRKLKDSGIDIDEWYKELPPNKIVEQKRGPKTI